VGREKRGGENTQTSKTENSAVMAIIEADIPLEI
jgi:hypothetical protein